MPHYLKVGLLNMEQKIPILAEMNCEGVIIGKAIYENRISLKQLETYILNS